MIEIDVFLIPLGGRRGGKAKVDARDALAVCDHAWSQNENGYVEARIKGKLVRLHAFILERMGATKEPGMRADHENRDKRDNTRCNLRWLTPSMSNVNKAPRPKTINHDCPIGVYRKRKKFAAYINVNGRRTFLGSFATIEEAAVARKRGEATYHV